MNITKSPNINQLWAELLIEELVRNGVTYFCIAPGSRSSPLVTAAAQNDRAQCFVHFDERGLAFHAMGYTAATKRPAVLICTSGTAAANFLPAVIEASKKKLPLIVLTADRPPELRNTGADQTMDQVRLYGSYVRWECDMPCPAKEISPDFVLTTVDQTVYRAKGNPPGPVHINCMYREPLAPIKTQTNFNDYCRSLTRWATDDRPFTQYVRHEQAFSDTKRKKMQDAITGITSGVIAVGKLSSAEDQKTVIKLSEKLNWPIFPDVTSGMRLGTDHANIIPYFNQILLNDDIDKIFPFDGAIHVGGRMTSKRWYDAIEQKELNTYMMVINHPLRNDPLHKVTHRIECGVSTFCNAVLKGLIQRPPEKIMARLQTASQKVDEFIEKEFAKTDKLSEPAVIRAISEHVLPNNGLFLANSMPIRDMDMYARFDKNPVNITANRGVSGIDGNLATAAGFLTGTDQPTTLIIGDIALLHDLNSLAMISKLSQPLIIVAINNNGGGIFSFLPIASFPETFETYFGTPHNLSFKEASDMFGLSYHCPNSLKEFSQIYKEMLRKKASGLIEIRTNRQENVKFHHGLQKNLQAVVKKCFRTHRTKKIKA